MNENHLPIIYTANCRDQSVYVLTYQYCNSSRPCGNETLSSEKALRSTPCLLCNPNMEAGYARLVYCCLLILVTNGCTTSTSECLSCYTILLYMCVWCIYLVTITNLVDNIMLHCICEHNAGQSDLPSHAQGGYRTEGCLL